MEEASRSGQDVDQEIAGKREEMAQKERQIQESRDRLLAFTQRLEELRQGADEATRQMEQAAVELAQYNASLAEQRIALSSTQTSVVEIRHRAGAVEESVRQAQERLACCPAGGQGTGGAAPGGGDGCLRPGERGQAATKCVWRAAAGGPNRPRRQWDKLVLDGNEQLRRAKLLTDLERNLEGFSQSVKQVMKEAGRGMLSGVCGPVTQLLKAPREYAVALETALGASMQHIVVETEQDAKNAIRLLKQRDWGPGHLPAPDHHSGQCATAPGRLKGCLASWAWPTPCAPARRSTAASGTACWAGWPWRRIWTAPRPLPSGTGYRLRVVTSGRPGGQRRRLLDWRLQGPAALGC